MSVEEPRGEELRVSARGLRGLAARGSTERILAEEAQQLGAELRVEVRRARRESRNLCWVYLNYLTI